MAKKTIDLGTQNDPKTGDSLHKGGGKINDNFDEIYNSVDVLGNSTGEKITPIDADNLTLWDSGASKFKKLTIANLKASLSIGYDELNSDLKATIHLNNGETEIDWQRGVLFVIPELTADITLTFTNTDANKRIMLLVKGEHNITFPANVYVADLSLDGTKWSIIQFENYATNVINKIFASNYDIE